MSFLRSRPFWIAAAGTLLLCGLFFAWELDWLSPWVWSPPRPQPKAWEMTFSALTTLLLGLDAGLIAWRIRNGTCPVGMRRATGLAGALGAATLLCPVCIALPFTLFGIAVTLNVLGPLLPLLRVIALVLLGSAGWMLLRSRT